MRSHRSACSRDQRLRAIPAICRTLIPFDVLWVQRAERMSLTAESRGLWQKALPQYLAAAIRLGRKSSESRIQEALAVLAHLRTAAAEWQPSSETKE